MAALLMNDSMKSPKHERKAINTEAIKYANVDIFGKNHTSKEKNRILW